MVGGKSIKKNLTLTAVPLQALIRRRRPGLDSTWQPSACPNKMGKKCPTLENCYFEVSFALRVILNVAKPDQTDCNSPVVSCTYSPSPADSVQLSVYWGHEYHREPALRLTWLKTRDDPHNHSCQCHTYRLNHTMCHQ